MIERLQRIATILTRFRLPITVMGGFSLVVLVLSVLDNPLLNSDELLMPAILGFCWALMLFSTSELFKSVPEKPSAEEAFRRRAAVSVRRSVLWVLGALTVVSSLGLVILTYQLMRVWL